MVSENGLDALCAVVAMKNCFVPINDDIYDDIKSAKKACMSDEKAFGVSLTEMGKFEIERSAKGAPFTDGDISSKQWVYLKAYNPSEGTKSLAKVANITPSKPKRGIYKMVYKLNNLMFLKLSRHTCEYVKKSKCRNCTHRKWHAVCLDSIKRSLLSFGN